MIKTYKDYLNENNLQLGKQIIRNYSKVIKLINSYYLPKLNINIIPYYNIYKTLFDNSNLELNEYKICLLVVSSFARLFKDNKINIEKLENEIRKNNIHELYKSSLNILRTTYSLLLIIRKSHKNIDILFKNKYVIGIIKDYINNKKIDIYNYNSLFKNDNEYLDIVDFVNKFKVN